MPEYAEIRQELAQLADLLAGMHHGVPSRYARAIQESDWLRGQVPQGVIRGSWIHRGSASTVAAVAAASFAAGLFTSPPGYALPLARAGQGPATGNLGSLGGPGGFEIPPPPAVMIPGAALAAVPQSPALQGKPAVETAVAKSPVAHEAVKAPADHEAAKSPEAARSPAEADVVTSPAEIKAQPAVQLPFAGQRVPPAASEIRNEPAQPPIAKPAPGKPAAAKHRVPHKGTAKVKAADAAGKAGRFLHKPLRWHVIQPGETLIKLARKYYDGAGAHWKGIFAVNKARVKNAHKVFPGEEIVIPTLAEAIAAERGHVPLLAAADAHSHKLAANGDRGYRKDRWRHKTRLAHRDPVVKLRPGLPI